MGVFGGVPVLKIKPGQTVLGFCCQVSVRRSGRKVAPVDLAAPRKDEASAASHRCHHYQSSESGVTRQTVFLVQADTERQVHKQTLDCQTACQFEAIAAYTAAIDCLDKYEPAADGARNVHVLPRKYSCVVIQWSSLREGKFNLRRMAQQRCPLYSNLA